MTSQPNLKNCRISKKSWKVEIVPDRKNEYTNSIRTVLSNMHDKSTHEDLYRIMDNIGDEALPSMLNLVNKIDKLNKKIYGMSKQIENLRRKTDRIY